MMPSDEMSVLSLLSVSKAYGGTKALDDVSLEIRAGEVHGLVGANGSGKSTLCKIVSGAVQPSSGRLQLGAEPVTFTNPKRATRHGIRMVYQASDLAEPLTVSQNVLLGHESLIIRPRRANLEVQKTLARLNFKVDPASTVATLTSAQKLMVEIARALRGNVRVLILDEPTAALTPEETNHLFQAVRDLTADGVAVIFVTHSIEDVLTISRRITVLHDGRVVSTRLATNTTREEIVDDMLGGLALESTKTASNEARVYRERPVLRVENVNMGRSLRNMSFSAYAGEILVLTGLVGCGRTEIAQVIFGALKRDTVNGGHIFLREKEIRYRTPAQAVRDGIAYVPEDRRRDGIFDTLTIAESIYAGRVARRKFRRGLIDKGLERRISEEFTKSLQVRSLSLSAKATELSGGNQQKVVIAKSLAQEPDLILLDEPTQGVDVGAIPDIHRSIRKLAESGRSVVVISSYLPEVLALADRILVLRQGSVITELPPKGTTESDILFAAVH